jgi:hypothetical protein
MVRRPEWCRTAVTAGVGPADDPRAPVRYAPSPPFAVHERGSHGASGSTVLVGGWNFAEDADVVVVVVEDPAPAPVVPAAEVGVTAVGGGFTLNCVPVTTVIRDPGWTWVGSMAMITAPLMEFATAWAAARLACVFDE